MAGHARLVRDLAIPVEGPEWPAWAVLAPFSATLAKEAHALLVDAYRGGFGTVPADFDTWWSATRHDVEFDAGLCFCALRGGQLVGFELCWTSAFIKDLVVHADSRRAGLGEALLRHALLAFMARGATEVALKVETANAPAMRLYRRLGFRDPLA